MRFFSWNVNGIRAAHKKGFLDWLQSSQADVVCLQETRAGAAQLPEALNRPDGYQAIWVAGERKGYSGVALLTRHAPQSIQMGLGIEEFDCEGRTIQADFGDYVLITAYFPNGGRDLSRVPYKMAYKAAFLETCERLRAEGKGVIFCGDVNTAHRPIDLARPKSNQNHTGFLPEERAWIDVVLEAGYVDAYRTLNPEQEGAYTWWAQWGGARDRNVGWRLDYFFVSPDLWPRVEAAEIHPEVLGSDHCPVSLTLQ